MKRNGFTLIELLAVIVILAIIALIATPIILGIINDAREESNERSVELYASAVRNGIAAYQLRTGEELEAKTYKSSELTFIEYDGDVECNTIEYYADGKIYVADCTVNDIAVEYTYGTKQTTQLFKPQYYSWDFEGTVYDTSVPLNPLTEPPTDKNIYLGYDVTDNVISTAYLCFVRKGTEYCLDGLDFDTNTTVLKDAFKDIDNACSLLSEEGAPKELECNADGFNFYAMSDGGSMYLYYDNANCTIANDFYFYCTQR